VTDREKLALAIEQANDDVGPSEDWAAVADRLIAAGWRLLPTSGPEFEAAADRASDGMADYEVDVDEHCRFEAARIGLRAALNPGEADA